MRIIKFIQLMILSLFFVGCDQYQHKEQGYVDLASAEKNSCYFNLDSKGNLVSWAPQNQVNFYFDLNFPEENMARVREVASVWKNSNGEPLITIATNRRASASSQNDGANIIYWIRDANRFQRNEQARTVVRWKSARIIDADILINAESFQYFNDPPSEGVKIHTPSLLVHEFGHTLGLRHIPLLASLMYPQLGFLQIRTEPQEIDVTSMRCKY
jgi:hypothetical protein